MSEQQPATGDLERVFDHFRGGGFVIIVDDQDRENEGDLAIAAEKVKPKDLALAARITGGQMLVALEEGRLNQLGIRAMGQEPVQGLVPPMAVLVDARHGITTGASAQDRLTTIRLLMDTRARPEDFVTPGHVIPLRARPGGVLTRAGHTEAAVDLARLSGLYPAGVLFEVVDEDGSMARLPALEEMGRRYNIPIVTVRELISHRSLHEKLVRRLSSARLPTDFGTFSSHVYESLVDGTVYVALVKGQVAGKHNVLVRVHSGCVTGDALHSRRCDCGEQLHRAMRMVEAEGTGVVLYIPHQEGRGIGLLNKHHAYELQDRGRDTVEANRELGYPPDLREYGIGAQVLADLGLSTLRLLTNNPRKVVGLEGHGLTVVERLPIQVKATPENIRYLKTKKEKLGHKLDI